MTLEQFRAARQAVNDLPAALEKVPDSMPELYSGPGVIYPGGLVIELCANSDDYCLTIGNVQHVGPLGELEAELYAWAVSEGIDEVVA